MKVLVRLVSLTGIFAVASTSFGQTPVLNVQKLKLSNGLTVLAVEDHTVPSIAYYTYFKVGSRNEHPGITGLSHLFEHMMFNGSARYLPKVFDQLVEGGGGYSNAFTKTDSTEYFEEFSSDTLETVVKLEADRMRSLKLDTANLEQERGIVKEERRVNTDNSVEGSAFELLENNAYVAHPYRWDVIGFMKDLDAIRLEDAKAYFRTYYAPNNAVVAVVGDFQIDQLFKLIEREYGSIPPQPSPRPVVNAEPKQKGEKRIAFHRAAELPFVCFAYHTISFLQADDAPLDVLAYILANGESSRLHKLLVYEKQITSSVAAENDSRIDPGLFAFSAQIQPGHTTEEAEAAIYATLEDIKLHGVTDRELQKAKNGILVAHLSKFKTNLGRAGLIAEAQAQFGDWRHINKELPLRLKVTSKDVQRMVESYFSDRNRTVVTVIPEKAAGKEGGK